MIIYQIEWPMNVPLPDATDKTSVQDYRNDRKLYCNTYAAAYVVGSRYAIFQHKRCLGQHDIDVEEPKSSTRRGDNNIFKLFGRFYWLGRWAIRGLSLPMAEMRLLWKMRATRAKSAWRKSTGTDGGGREGMWKATCKAHTHSSTAQHSTHTHTLTTRKDFGDENKYLDEET